jgi:hypothetical protein
MRTSTFMLLLLFVTTLSASSQSNSTFYYYQAASKPITLSEKVMVVKFIPGLTNAAKLQILNDAKVDYVSGSNDYICDVVQLKSRILTRQKWVYPCGIPPIEDLRQGFSKDTTLPEQNINPPCPTCPPPDCTPYQIPENYDNFYEALISLLNNSNIRSASKAIVLGTDIYSGMAEDFYIKIKPAYSIADFTSLISTYSLTATDVSSTFGSNIFKVSETRGGSRFCIERANLFYQTGKCDYSTPNFYDFVKLRTDDPLWSSQWNLLNTGQWGGLVGGDIRVVNAWPLSQGTNIKIGLIDEGTQLNQADLLGNLLPGLDVTGYGGNGGLVGGYFELHGTQMAGIMSARSDNQIDIAGVAPLSKVIPVKIFHANWDGNYLPVNDANLASAFIWTYQQGADVINCSWGLNMPNDIIATAINEAATLGRNGKGCFIVEAVSNRNESTLGFPESLPNIVAIGAINPCNERKTPTTNCDPNGAPYWDFGSSYGDKLSMVAPGIRIPTTPVTAFGYTANPATGTSGAAAQVSGVAALAYGVNPNLTRTELQRIMELGSNRISKYCYNWTPAHPNGPWNVEMGYGRLNAYNVVQLSRPGVTISNNVYDVPSQANTQLTGNLGILFSNVACQTTLPTGVNFVRRYEVTANVTFPTTLNPLLIASSNYGMDLANPNIGSRFADAKNITSTSATLRTYVYQGYNSSGQFLGWIPTNPTNIKFTYCVVGSPTAITYQTSRNISDSGKNISNIPFNLDPGQEIKMNDIPVNIYDDVIFPNPVANTLTIKVDPKNINIKSLQIFDLLGKRQSQYNVQNIRKNDVYISIDVTSLRSGVYILKIEDRTYKFIKQ